MCIRDSLSARPVSLKVGTRFVKGAFFRLVKNVKNGYIGQHGDAKLSWPYPNQFHTEPEDFDSFDSSAWQFLPPPVKQLIVRLRDAEKYMRWVIYLFGGLLFLNIVKYLGGAFLTSDIQQILERSFSAIGSIASIIGLMLAITLWNKR